MKSKEVLATEALTDVTKHESLETGLRLRDVDQTSARAGFVYSQLYALQLAVSETIL